MGPPPHPSSTTSTTTSTTLGRPRHHLNFAMSAADTVEGVTDPTDWVPTRLPSLQRLDNSLRCQVCKEFLSAPLITECSHTFCSLCIRRCFTQEQKCPSCRVPGQEARLRRNAGVEECVEAFLAVRGELLKLLGEVKEEVVGEVGERARWDGSGEGEGERERDERSPKRRRRGLRRSRSEVSYVEGGIEDVDWGGNMDEMDVEESTPKPVEVVEPDDGLFPCPGCNIRMKVGWIPYHIDACLKAKEDGSPLPPPPQYRTTRSSQPAPNNQQFFSQPPRTTRSSNTPQPQPQPQPSTATRLPKLNYSLLKDKTLREKLQEFGLPCSGTKAQLIARHSEWVNLYNANLDSLRPKPNRVLVQDLALWEKTAGKDFFSSASGGERRPTKLPGWSDEVWNREYGVMYEDLVKKAREGARKKVEDKGKEKEEDRNTLVEVAGGEAEVAEDHINGSPPTPHPEDPEPILEDEAAQVNMAMDTPNISTPTSIFSPNTIPPQPPTKQISQLELHPQLTSPSPSPSPYLFQPTHEDEDPYAVPPSSQNYKSTNTTTSTRSSSQPLYPYFHSTTTPNQSQPLSPLLSLPASYIPIAQPPPPPPPPSQTRTRGEGRPVGKRTRSQMEQENSGGGVGVGMGVGVEAGMGMEMEMGSSQGAMRID